MYKLNGSRNISPYSACMCITLFLALKRNYKDDIHRFPICDIELDYQDQFLEGLLKGYGIADNILNSAFRSSSVPVLGEMIDWGASRKALYDIMKNLQANMDADDFKNFAISLRDVWEPKSVLAKIFDWILRLLLGINM